MLPQVSAYPPSLLTPHQSANYHQVHSHHRPCLHGAFAQAGSSYLEDDPWDLTHGLLLIPSRLCWNVTHLLKPKLRKSTKPTSVSLVFWAYVCIPCTWEIADHVLCFIVFHTQLQQKINVDNCPGQSSIPVPMIHRAAERRKSGEQSTLPHTCAHVCLNNCNVQNTEMGSLLTLELFWKLIRKHFSKNNSP